MKSSKCVKLASKKMWLCHNINQVTTKSIVSWNQYYQNPERTSCFNSRPPRGNLPAKHLLSSSYTCHPAIFQLRISTNIDRKISTNIDETLVIFLLYRRLSPNRSNYRFSVKLQDILMNSNPGCVLNFSASC